MLNKNYADHQYFKFVTLGNTLTLKQVRRTSEVKRLLPVAASPTGFRQWLGKPVFPQKRNPFAFHG